MEYSKPSVYCCPTSGAALAFIASSTQNEDDEYQFNGELVSSCGSKYRVLNGIPQFFDEKILPKSDKEAMEYYENVSDIYDEYLPLTFSTFGVDELEERKAMVDLLHLENASNVLEIGCGTGRDTELIANKLRSGAKLFAQDISISMLHKAVERLHSFDADIEFSVANGCCLPFPDNYFDSVFHFGGLNTFSDIPRAFAEIARVTKPGGRVVIGDESMPPWLRKTEFGKILMNSNPHYSFSIPFDSLPVEARNVCLRWIIGGVFYVFDFSINDGEPQADFDFQIPGARGGTHRTRYYGQLEGLNPEIKKLAMLAREKSGISMYEWLNQVVSKAAYDQLN